MNILEFIDLYKSCEVSARLCLSTLEFEFDDVMKLSEEEYDDYRDFVRSLSPQWLVRVHDQCEVIELEILWNGFSGAEWDELLKYKPEWHKQKVQHYRAPKFFRN